MTDTQQLWAKRIGGVVAGLAVLLGLVWLFTPGDTEPVVEVEAVDADEPFRIAARRKIVAAAVLPDAEEEIPLEEDPNIPVVTPKCKLLVTYERKKVPQYSILDTLRDQSMMFDEDDLGCLTAAGVSPAILDLAEARVDYNKQRGIKGTPGKNLTREHLTYLEHPSHPDNQP